MSLCYTATFFLLQESSEQEQMSAEVDSAISCFVRWSYLLQKMKSAFFDCFYIIPTLKKGSITKRSPYIDGVGRSGRFFRNMSKKNPGVELLSHTLLCSTIVVRPLIDRVRDGNVSFKPAIDTGKKYVIKSKRSSLNGTTGCNNFAMKQIMLKKSLSFF